MSDEIHDEEERDMIEVTDENMHEQPLWLTAPERCWLAVGDEPEDWQYEFHDCVDVTWAEGGFCPVSVGIEYVRSDLYEALRAAAQTLAVERAEFRREAETLRDRLAAAESRLREYEGAQVFAVYCDENDEQELILRPRGGKGE